MSLQVTVRLPTELAAQVDREAHRRRLRRSDVVRMALYAFLERDSAPEDGSDSLTPYERVAHLIGSIDSGIPDLGSRHEEHLRKAFDRGQ